MGAGATRACAGAAGGKNWVQSRVIGSLGFAPFSYAMIYAFAARRILSSHQHVGRLAQG